MPVLPRFSVVVPAFNAIATVGSAMASVLGQTEADLELIVVDDGSTDATPETVRQAADPRVRLVSTPNAGPAAARNRGIAASRGTHVSFLDSDDLWLPDYLERVREAIAGQVNLGFAYTDAYAFDARTGRVRRGSAMFGGRPPVPAPGDPGRFLFELLKRNFVYVSTTVPRSVLDAVGGFDETRTGSEDYDLWLRIAVRGHRAVHIPGRHALYRLHSGQKSQNAANRKRNQVAMYHALSLEAMPTAEHRTLLARRRREAERDLRLAEGDPWLAAAVSRLRARLGTARQALGLGGYAWCSAVPAEVATAFLDLTRV